MSAVKIEKSILLQHPKKSIPLLPFLPVFITMGQNTKCLCKRHACAADHDSVRLHEALRCLRDCYLFCETKSIINSFHNKKRAIPSYYAAGASVKGNASKCRVSKAASIVRHEYRSHPQAARNWKAMLSQQETCASALASFCIASRSFYYIIGRNSLRF